MEITYSLNEIPEIAKKIIAHCEAKIVLFYAEMGSGKTTLIKEIVKQLGSIDTASSPTFAIANEYLCNNGETLYHFDFYRLKDEEEAYDMGLEDYIDSGNWCFMEWPAVVENLLPLESVTIRIEKNNDHSRTLYLTNPS
jgi:tRNA threonylcarbamoyladenosine biosynthesis protein TsaE